MIPYSDTNDARELASVFQTARERWSQFVAKTNAPVVSSSIDITSNKCPVTKYIKEYTCKRVCSRPTTLRGKYRMSLSSASYRNSYSRDLESFRYRRRNVPASVVFNFIEAQDSRGYPVLRFRLAYIPSSTVLRHSERMVVRFRDCNNKCH